MGEHRRRRLPVPVRVAEVRENKTVESKIEIGVQINGKLKTTIVIPNGCTKEEALAIANADSKIAALTEGKNVVKEIYVPNKIVNIVVK